MAHVIPGMTAEEWAAFDARRMEIHKAWTDTELCLRCERLYPLTAGICAECAAS